MPGFLGLLEVLKGVNEKQYGRMRWHITINDKLYLYVLILEQVRLRVNLEVVLNSIADARQ